MSHGKQSLSGIGYEIANVDVTAVLRGTTSTGCRTGDVVLFCLTDVSLIGSTSTAAPGTTLSTLANVTMDYTSTAVPYGIAAVALQDIPWAASSTAAADTNPLPVGKFRVQGYCQAKVQHSTGNTAWVRGAPLVVSYATTGGFKKNYLDAVGQGSASSTTSARFVGIALQSSAQAIASGNTSVGALTWVVFDGINGFGSRGNGFVVTT